MSQEEDYDLRRESAARKENFIKPKNFFFMQTTSNNKHEQKYMFQLVICTFDPTLFPWSFNIGYVFSSLAEWK